MPKRISDVFNVEPTLLKKLNVFNGFINLDSPLYIDPRLLGKSLSPEFENSEVEFNNFLADIINDILVLIEFEKKCDLGDRYIEEFTIKQKQVKDKLKFRELPLAGLGYSTENNDGKGIGDGIANDLFNNIKAFVKVGIVDPVIFQLAEVFVDNIGADRISDMIICILLPQLVRFSRRIAKELNLPKTRSITINNVDCSDLPCYSNKLILLVPEDILRLLPLYENGLREDYTNSEIRESLNYKMRQIYPITYSKYVLKGVLLESPQIMTNMIKKYISTTVDPYDFTKDPLNLFNWHEVARYYAKNSQYPLNIKDEVLINYPFNKNVLEIIGVYFSQLVKKELYKELYDENGVAKKEIICVNILLQILEYNLQDSRIDVRYSRDDKAIKIANYYSIILKFTSTRGICQKFYQIIKDTYFYPSNSRSKTSFAILIIIIVDGGKSKYEIEESYYKNIKNSGVIMTNRVIENKFVKIFYIDARLNRT